MTLSIINSRSSCETAASTVKAIFPAAVEVSSLSLSEIKEQLLALNSSKALNKCVVDLARRENAGTITCSTSLFFTAAIIRSNEDGFAWLQIDFRL